MEKLTFKTTIKCSGCVAAVTPALNEAVGKDNWEVNVENPDKVLTITSGNNLDAARIIKAIEGAGYKAERLDK